MSSALPDTPADPRHIASRNLIFLNFASSFPPRRWRARACSGAGTAARPAFPCPRVKQREAPDADLGDPLGRSANDQDRLAGPADPCAAFEGLPPFSQREVWLITARSRPVPASSASLASSPASGSTTKNMA
jgi:hypothetical protein